MITSPTTFKLPSEAPKRLVDLLKQWQTIALSHRPRPEDLSFDDLIAVHPGLAVIEAADSSKDYPDFRYVRVGPEHAHRTGAELEGQLFSDVLYSDVARRASAEYQEAIQTGMPQYWEFVNSVFGSPPEEYVRLLLPMHDETGEVISLLGSWVWKES